MIKDLISLTNDQEFLELLQNEASQWNSMEGENVESNCEGNTGLVTVMSANGWIEHSKSRPYPKMLFSEFWYEGEICFLFADTNTGKSILAVQIGESISKGVPVPRFILEAPAQPVIYFDFELSPKQFETRYMSEEGLHYDFPGHFFRAELNPDADLPDGIHFEDYLIQSVEESIGKYNAKVLIIDNITYLGNDNEKAKDALPLMKQLKTLKAKYDLSILVLAHTPKRDSSRPLTRNDIHGSKMLMNFCDSAFAIGVSHMDSKLRYLKQIKQRNTEEKYGSDNVCLCQIVKDNSFLKFELLSYGCEWDHLNQQSEDDRNEKKVEAKRLQQQGLSQREIAQRLGISVGTVNNYLKS